MDLMVNLFSQLFDVLFAEAAEVLQLGKRKKHFFSPSEKFSPEYFTLGNE